MTEVIVPLTERSDTRRIADVITSLVNSPLVRKELNLRHLWGVVDRYGSGPSIAEDNINQAREKHRLHKLGAFLVLNEREQIRGLASILPNLELRRQSVPVWAVVGRKIGRPLSSKLEGYGINVAAWVSDENQEAQDLLQNAYSDLITQAIDYCETDSCMAWTIEPKRSPWYVHYGILDSGMHPTDTARFDDYESGKKIPPSSVLYQAHILTPEIPRAA